MSDSNFVEVGVARLSRTEKALELNLYLLGVRLFIDLGRLKGIIEKGEVNAPIWIQRFQYNKVKQKRH